MQYIQPFNLTKLKHDISYFFAKALSYYVGLPCYIYTV